MISFRHENMLTLRRSVTACYNDSFMLDFIRAILASIGVFFRTRMDASLEVVPIENSVCTQNQPLRSALRDIVTDVTERNPVTPFSFFYYTSSERSAFRASR